MKSTGLTLTKKINAKDRAAIAAALESVKLSDISSNLNRFSRGTGICRKIYKSC